MGRSEANCLYYLNRAAQGATSLWNHPGCKSSIPGCSKNDCYKGRVYRVLDDPEQGQGGVIYETECGEPPNSPCRTTCEAQYSLGYYCGPCGAKGPPIDWPWPGSAPKEFQQGGVGHEK